MWIILILLWVLPVSLGIVIAARVLGGLPAVTREEWRALFRDRKDFKVSIWMGLTFTIVAMIFFFVGVLQGLVLTNIGSYGWCWCHYLQDWQHCCSSCCGYA